MNDEALEIECLKALLAEKESEIKDLQKRNDDLEAENRQLKISYEQEKRDRIRVEEELKILKYGSASNSDVKMLQPSSQEDKIAEEEPRTLKYGSASNSDVEMLQPSSQEDIIAEEEPRTLKYSSASNSDVEMLQSSSQEDISAETIPSPGEVLKMLAEQNKDLKKENLELKTSYREKIINTPGRPERPYIKKVPMTEAQLKELVKLLANTRHPIQAEFNNLAEKTGLTEEKIRRWFSGIHSKVRHLMDKAAEESSKLRSVMDLEKIQHDDIDRVFYQDRHFMNGDQNGTCCSK